jgi:hypothetical protein
MGFSIYDVRDIDTGYQWWDDAELINTVSSGDRRQDQHQVLLSSRAINTGTTDVHVVMHMITGEATVPQPILVVTVPAGAGNGTVPVVDLLDGTAPQVLGLWVAPRGFDFGWSIMESPSAGGIVQVTNVFGFF